MILSEPLVDCCAIGSRIGESLCEMLLGVSRLHEHVVDKTIEFARIDTKQQRADGFTKALPLPAFTVFRDWVLNTASTKNKTQTKHK